MLEQVPADLGRVISQPLTHCSQCSRQTIAIDLDDDEPLCSVCRIADKGLAQVFAGRAIRELVVPVEIQHATPPRFGRGSGEIGSGDLVHAMNHDTESERDAALCRRLLWAFSVLEGLVLLAVAAAR